MEKGTVLVIEGNEMDMKLMRTVLQINGNYAVLEAENAEDGIEMARKHRPDIILMDIQLPGMSGLEATLLIKSDTELRYIPVVAVTSSAMLADEKRSLEAGCAGHISKPIDVQSFVSTMEQFLIVPKTTMASTFSQPIGDDDEAAI